MPIKEQATKQVVLNALEVQAISTDTATTGGIIDTADYDNGIYFAMVCTAYTDGTYTLTIYDGDNAALSDAAIVTSLIYTAPSLSAKTAETSVATPVGLPKLGVYGTKRYLRATITSASTSSGATLGVFAIANPEIAKTPQTI